MPLRKAEILEFTLHGNIGRQRSLSDLNLTFFCRAECEAQTKGFPDAKYQKFSTRSTAEEFISGAAPSEPNPSFSTDVASSRDAKGKKRAFGPEVADVSGWDIVYSDGACKGNGKVGSIAGVGVWWGPNNPRQAI